MQISTGDVVVGNGAIDLYCGRSGGVWCCRTLLETMLKGMTLHISTGDAVVGFGNGMVGYVALDLYWGRCGRKLGDRSLLGMEW